jgi:hypothetical protein
MDAMKKIRKSPPLPPFFLVGVKKLFTRQTAASSLSRISARAATPIGLTVLSACHLWFDNPTFAIPSWLVKYQNVIALSKRILYSVPMSEKNPAAVQLGKLGGSTTAKRGAEYFRQIAKLRKRPGRPINPHSARQQKLRAKQQS